MKRIGIGLLQVAVMAWATAAEGQEYPQQAEMLAGLKREVVRAFTMPKVQQLDPELRAAAEKIGADQVKRIENQLPGWLLEEKLALNDTTSQKARLAYTAVAARVLNELAYWHIEPGDAAYERATIELIKTSPAACKIGELPYTADFARRIARIQAMPPAQRAAALEAEARLLERWGKPHAEPLPWPETPARQQIVDAVARIPDGKRPLTPLPPVLAWLLLSEGRPYDDLPPEVNCHAQRWWLVESLAQGVAPATAINAFRYGTLVTATVRFGRAFDPPAGEAPEERADGRPAFPGLASRYGVSGVTKVRRTFDASGKPVRATVSVREITVPGIRGMRPIAFEDTFDKGTLKGGLNPAMGAVTGVPLPPEVKLVWGKTYEPEGTPAKAAGEASQ